ncbi:hypothetical protein NPIL_70641 [Nephila pilipes]|uniref:Uncharacterized protein n=1 Tax=Nephila pilipes TaxID=299642 RepID=A0A8X6PNV3_NEPPI|nr:hypothetical protein NPIL_70641 [Nephila pilipes]
MELLREFCVQNKLNRLTAHQRQNVTGASNKFPNDFSHESGDEEFVPPTEADDILDSDDDEELIMQEATCQQNDSAIGNTLPPPPPDRLHAKVDHTTCLEQRLDHKLLTTEAAKQTSIY